MLGFLSLTLCILSAASPRGPWDLVASPVQVQAVLRETEPATELTLGSYGFDITVSDGFSTYSEASLLVAVADIDEAVKVLRSTTVWRPPYLFVRTECGGGNAWACNEEVVFRLHGRRLRRFGVFAVNDDRKAAASFHGDHFDDLYDRMEGLLCHACSPSFRMAVRDSNGRQIVESALTWEHNQPWYAASFRAVSAHRPGRPWPADSFEELLRCSLLARYCNRKDELGLLSRLARLGLSPEQKKALRTVSELPPLQPSAAWR